jgi:glycosyltransferase involved in cell wall biosynthesis
MADEGPESRTFEGGGGRSTLDRLILAGAPIAHALSRATIRRADVVVAVSEAAKHAVQDLVPAAHVVVIPPGVDTELFSPADDRFRSNEILAVGYLVKRKRVHLLIQALALLRAEGADVTLRVVGDGPERTFLEAEANRHGLREYVRFDGLVPNSNLPALYRRALITCLVSRSEAAATAPLESLACATPVVCTRTGLMAEILNRVPAGVLVEDSADSIASAIRTLLANPEQRQEMGRLGRTLIEADHSWAAVSKQYADAYVEAVTRRTGRVVPPPRMPMDPQ